MKMHAVICLGLLTLSGCVSVGTKIDPNVVSTFKPGITTIEDAETKLGKPNETTQNADGTTLIQYIYVKSHADGASYIPIVGIFAGKSIADNVISALTFDKNGRFLRATTSQGHTAAGMMGGS